MKMVVFILLVLTFILLSCHKKDDNGFYIFKIKEGKHRSVNRVELTKKTDLNFTFILTESCIYNLENKENQYDVNKLFGMSDGGNHMDNSARLGWRYLNGKLEILGYTHYNKQFDFEKICDVEPNVEYNCQISFLEGKYRFIVGSNTLEMGRFNDKNKRNYILYPYFGGDEVSPHDMTIKIKY
jgi:hypothetical protein